MKLAWLIASCVVCGGAAACDAEETGIPPVSPPEGCESWDTLEEWHLFRDAAQQIPNDGVVPYDVISPLYSDYAYKRRFLWLPPGAAIGYQPDDAWDLPLGSIVVKSFSYATDARDLSLGERLLETRLLVNTPCGWKPSTYVWDEARTQAPSVVAGDVIPSSFIDDQGNARENGYIVPNTNECKECHCAEEESDEVVLLGVRTRQLDRDGASGNQIDHLADLGWLASPPPAAERDRLVDPFGDAPLVDRTRSYLDANCAHCHNPAGCAASQSGLFLRWQETEPATNDPGNWGVCKTPTSADGATCGHTFDVVPGSPDESIMICRIASDEAEVRMPSLASRIPHDEGVALVSEWITAMTPVGCP
jgi:uncharacterized repeat protein (TIGR03806 family)